MKLKGIASFLHCTILLATLSSTYAYGETLNDMLDEDQEEFLYRSNKKYDNITVRNQASLGNLYVGGNITTENLTVRGNEFIAGNLTVLGATSFTTTCSCISSVTACTCISTSTGSTPTGTLKLTGDLLLPDASADGTAGVLKLGVDPIYLYNTGNSNFFAGDYSTGAGLNVAVTGANNISIGTQANAALTTANNTIAIGSANGAVAGADATATGAIAIGGSDGTVAGSHAAGADSVAIGVGTTTNGTQTNQVAIGTSAAASANSAIAIGSSAVALSTNSIALGLAASSTGSTSSIAIGNGAIAHANNTISIGTGNTASAGNSIVIGHGLNDVGLSGTYIGGISGVTTAGGVAVYCNTNGQLGTVTSSRNFKENFRSLDTHSAQIYKLKPLLFDYREEHGGEKDRFGLLAEEVNEALPEIVVRDAQGEIYSVQYHNLVPLLLNEVIHHQKQIDNLKTEISQLKALLTAR